MAVSISQYQSQLPVIWFLISIMGNFFIGRERLLPNVAWLGHFSLGLDMTRHAVLLGNSVAQGGMSWIGRIPCFVFSWFVQNTNQLSWAIKLWNDMTNYWATSFVYMDYCPFFSIVMPRLTFWKIVAQRYMDWCVIGQHDFPTLVWLVSADLMSVSMPTVVWCLTGV